MATPEGWERRPLRSVATSFSGGTPSRSVAAYFGGGIPWVKSGEVNARRIRHTEESISQEGLDNSSAKWVEPGSVLIAMYGATAGKVARLEIRATVNQAILAVHGRADSANNEFLFHVLDAATPELIRRTQGSGQPNLSGKLIQDLAVLLPPLPEQRKIAAILSAVDAVIEKTEAVIESLQALKKAMMQELLTRGLPGRHTRFKQTEIGEVPEEWEVVPLLDVVQLPSGQVDPRIEPYRQWILVAPNHIESVTGRLLQRETAATQGAISGKYTFRSGDVVYSKIRPYLRKAWLASFDGICSADMYPMRPTDQIRPGYLLGTLLSDRFTEFAASVSMRTGIPKINRAELTGYLVALPSLDEQTFIENALAAVDTRLLTEADILSLYRVTKQALMSVLLTGELRVTPDQDVA